MLIRDIYSDLPSNTVDNSNYRRKRRTAATRGRNVKRSYFSTVIMEASDSDTDTDNNDLNEDNIYERELNDYKSEFVDIANPREI